MISTMIIKVNEYCSIGDDKDHHGCVHTIKFDPENLIISSKNSEQELCSILFEITPDLVKELKAFVNVLEVSQELCSNETE